MMYLPDNPDAMLMLIMLTVTSGCQSVTYRVDVSGSNNRVDIPGNTAVAKPIEVSPTG